MTDSYRSRRSGRGNCDAKSAYPELWRLSNCLRRVINGAVPGSETDVYTRHAYKLLGIIASNHNVTVPPVNAKVFQGGRYALDADAQPESVGTSDSYGSHSGGEAVPPKEQDAAICAAPNDNARG